MAENTTTKKLRLVCTDCGQSNQFPADKLDAAPKCAVCGAGLATGKVAPVDLRTLEKAAKSDGLPLLVDFWAPWCGPCRAMAPEFDRVAQALKGKVRLVKIDTNSHPDAAIRYSIRGIPHFILFDRGREVARFSGARPAAELERMVRAKLG